MTIATTSLAVLPQICKVCGHEYEAAPIAIWGESPGPLEPLYSQTRTLPSRETIERRARSLWRYHEWLPFEGEPVFSRERGHLDERSKPRLAREHRLANAVA